MINKKKNCKGTGKAKGYGCNSLELIRTYGLGHSCGCYPKWLYQSDEGRKKLNNAIKKATAPRIEIEEGIKQKKQRISLQYLKNNTTAIVHKYIRLRDKGKSCISCGIEWSNNFQAGHYYKAELYSSLKYNEFNINGQCMTCNIRKEGNLNLYAINLPKRIGEKNFDKLNKLASLDKKNQFKWDREDLIKIKNHYKNLIKKMK